MGKDQEIAGIKNQEILQELANLETKKVKKMNRGIER